MITDYDMPARFPGIPRAAVELAMALAIIAMITAIRLLIDHFYTGVVPYALVFPAIAAATIVAGPRCGRWC